MRRPPTDLEILKEIHRRYAAEFTAYDEKNPTRETKYFVPIDIKSIADEFGADPDSILGRLYYDMDRRHGYETDAGEVLHLFTSQIGSDKHAVNFPLLEAVLANLQQSRDRFIYPLMLSIVALVLSILGYFRAGN